LRSESGPHPDARLRQDAGNCSRTSSRERIETTNPTGEDKKGKGTMRSSQVRQGFTLIELLVVIAIIAILAAILFPVFAQARKQAYKATGTSNVKQASLGILMYSQDFDEKMPRAGW